MRLTSLAAAVLLANACADEPGDTAPEREPPLVSQALTSPVSFLTTRQREFFAAMADSTRDVMEFLYADVRVYDFPAGDSAASVQQAVSPAFSSGLLKLLADRLPGDQLGASRFEVLRQEDGSYAVLSFSDAGLPAATVWEMRGDVWKVRAIRLNIPLAEVEAARQRNRRLVPR